MLFLVLVSVLITASNSQNNACEKLEDYLFKDFSRRCYRNPDIGSTTPEIIRRRGYKVESHVVTTEDGYILEMFRIPPEEGDYRRNRQPIFLLHGILGDSVGWVFVGNRSIGLSLAAEGYDVWLGNQRGTRYSRRHTTLKDSDNKFWDYSMDTLAAYDIPAFLNKIAAVTGQPGNIIYMGHSRAIIELFMYASEHPEHVNGLVRGVVAFAPTVYLEPRHGVLLVFSTAQAIGKSLSKIGVATFFQNPQPIINLAQILCSKFSLVCRIVAAQILGPTDQFLPEDLLNFFSHFPAPFTIKEFIQHGQFYESQEFKMFDYGAKENLQVYGVEKPPLYDLGRVTLPTFIFYGENDVYISEKGVNRILRELGSERKAGFKVPIGDSSQKFAHVDVLFAQNLTEILFKDVKEVLERELQPYLYLT